MRNVSPDYAAEWLNGLATFDKDNTLILLAVLTTFGLPASYLDVGSGSGAMVKAAYNLGIKSCGVDILPAQHRSLVEHDLCTPFDLQFKFNLVTSIETAEHIEPEFADVYLENIARHVAEGGTLVFTAAMPGQPGHGHVNCQPAEYWRSKLYGLGLVYNAEKTYRLALAWSIASTPLHHLEANLQVFNGY